MKILITGALGLVGSEAMKFFEEKGWETVGLDANLRAHFFGTQTQSSQKVLDVDIRDEHTINWLFNTHKFDAIIHAAGQPAHEWANDHVLEDFDINARGTIILLEATRKFCPEATFVHVSTDKVYGENMKENTPFKEDLGLDFAGRRSFFGCSKTAADVYAQEYANYLGMKVGIFRPGCITGRNHQGATQHGFLAYIAKCVREGIHYKINGFQGEVVRDQIHAYDLVNAFYHFIQNPHPGEVYNIGGGPERAISLLQAMGEFSKIMDKKASYEFLPTARKGDRPWDVHDVSKFRKDYPEWDYKYSLSDILKDVANV